MLSRKFLERVRSEHMVDTRKYRYIWYDDNNLILRKELKLLATATCWQTVASFEPEQLETGGQTDVYF